MADPFPAVLMLNTLDGTNGFRINSPDFAGNFGVVAVGDFDGDGIDDLVLGSPSSSYTGVSSGSLFIVFGRSGIPSIYSPVVGDGVARIDGLWDQFRLGEDVAAIGDINGDGKDDFLVSQPGLTRNGQTWGSAFVFYGQDSFPDTLYVNDLTPSQGFEISLSQSAFGSLKVAAVGDVNGDGVNDFAIGLPLVSDTRGQNGVTYIVYGGQDFGAGLDLGSMSVAQGATLFGALVGEASGVSVSSAGDLNGDGIGDLLIGAIAAAGGGYAGAVHVVYGRDGGFGGRVDLAGLSASEGFRIDGLSSYDQAGASVTALGDVNGDGFADFAIGAPYGDAGVAGGGTVYIVFGQDGGFASGVDLATLDGSNGFAIGALGGAHRLGREISSAGDINGDGFADIVIAAPQFGNYYQGAVFVVFGGETFSSGTFDLAGLNGTNGFRIEGASFGGGVGQGGMAVGDINGDGIDDLVIGAQGGLGRAYVVYGRFAPPGPIVEVGTPGNDTYTGGVFDDVLSGADGDDNLDGGDGDDTLDGGTGVDIMIGGAGNDTYYVDNVGDTVDETGGDGVDQVFATVTFTLGAGVENLTLTGSANINGAGNGLANIIIGNDGNNILTGGDGNDRLFGGLGADDLVGGVGSDFLDGGLGADEMAGGAGDDIYIVDDEGDVVTELAGGGIDRIRASVSYFLGDHQDHLQLIGTADINGIGNELANQIDGNSGANNIFAGDGADIVRGWDGGDSLYGQGGADLLLGGEGDDFLWGGADNDRLQGGNGADRMWGEDGNDILDGDAGADTLTGGIGNDQLNGGADNDTLWGDEGNDRLDGGTGDDTMMGGLGDDVYFVDSLGDSIVEYVDEGIDTVRASVSWTLGLNLERLVLEGTADLNGTGNGLANQITGNDGANILDGAAGNDVLKGGAGEDRLIGGTGNDILTGGTGADTFVVGPESIFSGPGPRTIEMDTITDYEIGMDIIDLSAIDPANETGAFSFVSAFDGTAGQMTLKFAGGVTTLSLDFDGDMKADYLLKINGDVTGESGRWLL